MKYGRVRKFSFLTRSTIFGSRIEQELRTVRAHYVVALAGGSFSAILSCYDLRVTGGATAPSLLPPSSSP